MYLKKIYLISIKKKVKVYYDEILYIESLKDYSRIHTLDVSLVTRGQIGELEALFKKYNIKSFTMDHVMELGIGEVMRQSIEYLDP